MKLRTLSFAIASLLLSTIALAQQKPAPTDYSGKEHGIAVRSAVVYLAPDVTSEKLVTLDRGREVAILERTTGWLHVLATISQQFKEDRDVSGWILDKGFITKNTPNGELIMYGEAVDAENEASRRGGRKGADTEARRLYFRVADYFPSSPLAAEALYRAADIQWQLDRADVESRRRRQTEIRDRPQINDEFMKMVQKKYPGTKQADLAAFHILENKLCLEWQAESKCPEKEAEIYEKYANDHPNSPAYAEALMEAARRHAALIEIYKSEGQAKKAPDAAQRAIGDAQRALAKNQSADWNARAQRMIYAVQSNIPLFGNTVE